MFPVCLRRIQSWNHKHSGRLIRCYFTEDLRDHSYQVIREYSYMNDTQNCTMEGSDIKSRSNVRIAVEQAALETVKDIYVSSDDADSCIDVEPLNNKLFMRW